MPSRAVRHRPPAHRRRAHPAPDPQLSRGGAALRLRSPGRARPASAHRLAAPPGAPPGRAGPRHPDRPVRPLPPPPRPRHRRAGCFRPSWTPWSTTTPGMRAERDRAADRSRSHTGRGSASPTPRDSRTASRDRHDPPHPRGRRRAGHHGAGGLPSRQGRVPGLHRQPTVPTRSRRRGRSDPDIVILDLMLPGRLRLRRPGRAAPAGGDPGRRRHPPHRAPGGDRPHPGPLARRRRLPHQAVLAAGALAAGARAAPPARPRHRSPRGPRWPPAPSRSTARPTGRASPARS